MPRKTLAAIAVAAALAGGGIATYAAPPFSLFGSRQERPKKQDIQWQTDLFAAHKLSQQHNKPMLIVFGAEWCGYCKKMEAQTLTQPEVAGYINAHFIPVHLDADKEERVTKILEIESLPCSVVLSPNADLLGRIDGYVAAETFQRRLSASRENMNQLQIMPVRGE